MNVFEEHQLFIPIINDARFAIGLRALCMANRPGSFKQKVINALFVLQCENELNVQSENAEAVRTALWDYYINSIKEERATDSRKSVYVAESSNPSCEIPTPPKEPEVMNDKPNTFETKHFVNGVEASTLSDSQLIHAIKVLESEISSLKEVKTESQKILAKIASLDQQRQEIAALLDSRP